MSEPSNKLCLEPLLPITCHGMHWLYLRGYHLFERLYGDVERLSADEGKDDSTSDLLHDVWLAIGDLQFCNNALNAAIRAYEMAAVENDEYADALFEIGQVYFCKNQYDDALEYFQKASLQHPTEKTTNEIRSVTELKKKGTPQRYDPNVSWRIASEHLAVFRPDLALTALEGDASPQGRLVAAQAKGALNDEESAIANMAAAIDSQQIELLQKDFFFLPISVWESESFWQQLLSRRDIIRALWHSDPQCPSEKFCPPELLEVDDYAKRSRVEEQTAVTEFHLARITGDIETLKKQFQRYPRWRVLFQTINFIESFGRSPTWVELQWYLF